MTKAFPKNFFWGEAIAINQAEGVYSEDGRGFVAADATTGGSVSAPRYMTYIDKDGKPGKASAMRHNSKVPEDTKYAVLDTERYPNHVVVDLYHRYKEDTKLFAGVGCSVFHLSISRARIFPNGDGKESNQTRLDFYRSVFEECHKYNIKPLVSIWHFDTPFILEERYGGWKNCKFIDFYMRYYEAIFAGYKDLVRYWLTLNEINDTAIFLNMFGARASDADYQDNYRILCHQFVTSAKTVQLGHTINPDFMVGNMACGITSYPGTCNPAGILANEHKWESDICYYGDVRTKGKYDAYARCLRKEHNVELSITAGDLKDLKRGTTDMHTFSHYMSDNVTTYADIEGVAGNFSTGAKSPYLTCSNWGWAHDPVGLQYYLGKIYDRYGIPLMVAGNGLGAFDMVEDDDSVYDDYCIDYHRVYINVMVDAIGNGVDLIGYTAWGCIGIVSAGTGEICRRYSFIYIDMDDAGNGTLDRTPKDNFYQCEDVLATDGQKAIEETIQSHQLI